MKTGRSLGQLAAEIERQAQAKKDYIAPRAKMQLQVLDRDNAKFPVLALLNGNGGKQFGINEIAHDQLATRLEIPRNYYDRMRTKAPALLAGNVNHWLQNHEGEKSLMVRTLDGDVRALLSDRYRPLDNHDLAEAVLPIIQEHELYIVSCELTERKLYIKAFDKRIHRDIERKGSDPAHTFLNDVVYPALTISNSEVGCGSVSVAAGLYTGGCTNFASFSDSRMKKYHIGGKAAGSDDFYALLSDDTKRLTDQAIWAQTRDVVRSAFEIAKFEELVGRLQGATEQKIEGDVLGVVEVTSKRFGFTEQEKGGVLKHLIAGGDLSQYGLFNAITRTAEDLPDYDRATQFERFGGDVIELSRKDWEVINTGKPAKQKLVAVAEDVRTI